ncbi:hypothetical protein RM531_05970 [Salinisphaera sp. P385]|uniref:DUF3137 domain-containing protein n=1 Tax=Spectribacter acetivorans TaxID=3075603 RepID=A0ABU3B6D7_9GAMM|nr:hypothetical protein [Salinisphaera sp. P385]MDT0618012.1 hypothetical protein [Salinisphaera sp. P385]
MDPQQLRTSQTPAHAKAAIVVLLMLLTSIGIAAAAAAYWFFPENYDALLQAAAYSLGISVPLLCLAILLSYTRFGGRTTREKLARFLTVELPGVLAETPLSYDVSREDFRHFDGDRRPITPLPGPPNDIRLVLEPLTHKAYYLISSPALAGTELLFSVELALPGITVCVFVNRKQGAAEPDETLRERFASSIDGAESSGGYRVDKAMPWRDVAGAEHRTLIFRKQTASDDFLVDEQEKLFFSIDLGLMMASLASDIAGTQRASTG